MPQEEKNKGLTEDQARTIWGDSFDKLFGRNDIAFFQDHITVTLQEPLKLNSGDESQYVDLKKPKVYVLEAMDSSKGEIGKGRMMLAQWIGCPAAGISNMDAGDFVTLQEVAAAFLQRSRATGLI
jgi:hypothetical protein